jgi:hypothetical protein
LLCEMDALKIVKPQPQFLVVTKEESIYQTGTTNLRSQNMG